MDNCILPLELLAPGDCAIVEDVQGEPQWIGRMAELGIRHGSELQVVQPGRPCVLQVAGCRLCLRGEEGCRIFVRPIAS